MIIGRKPGQRRSRCGVKSGQIDPLFSQFSTVLELGILLTLQTPSPVGDTSFPTPYSPPRRAAPRPNCQYLFPVILGPATAYVLYVGYVPVCMYVCARYSCQLVRLLLL